MAWMYRPFLVGENLYSRQSPPNNKILWWSGYKRHGHQLKYLLHNSLLYHNGNLNTAINVDTLYQTYHTKDLK